jgi:hypothetical protein
MTKIQESTWVVVAYLQPLLGDVPKHETLIGMLREIGRAAVAKKLPESLNMYAAGHFGKTTYHGVEPAFGLSEVEIKKLLSLGRYLKSFQIREQVQGNSTTALRDIITGQILTEFEPEDWEQLTWRIGYTTLIEAAYLLNMEWLLDRIMGKVLKGEEVSI